MVQPGSTGKLNESFDLPVLPEPYFQQGCS